jgi:putative DNA primase/helicase
MMSPSPSNQTREAAPSTMLGAAQALAARGWPVFPCDGKRPRTAHGLHDATADPVVVERWWSRVWPGADVAVRTGTESGLLVLDVDPDHGGDDALHALEREHGALPATIESLTGGGGRHLIFKHPGYEVRNSAGKIGAGLDVRGANGYIIAPPSRHASGRSYEWSVDGHPDDLAPAPAPEWLLAMLRAPAPRTNGSAPANGTAAGAIAEGRRNAELASLAGAMRRRGADPDAIAAALRATNITRCTPPLPGPEVDAIAASVSRYDPAPAGDTHSDLANAQAFVRDHADQLRYVAQRKRWLTWDAARWRPDLDGTADRAAKTTAAGLLTRATAIEDAKERAKAAKWALTSQSEPRVRAMLTLARTEPAIVVTEGQLDADAYLLACANGTLDLRTGDLRDADPADLITRGTDVDYNPDATCARWERFLHEIFNDDHDLIAFVHRLVGYCLTGDTREHLLAVLHGAGCNGKSTLLEILKALLGDLATTSAFDTFARARGDRGPRNDLARLRGARLVTGAESGEGRRLDEATVKEITGGDTIAARFLFGEHFEFRPTFKLLLVTNHLPRVDGDDDAIWRRLRLVPFEQSFEGREDRDLSATLHAELPGILAWAVRGCLAWQTHGLGQAGAVTQATAEYRSDEDSLGAFLAECTTHGGEVRAPELRSAYEDHCAQAGEKPLSSSALGKRLAKRGVRAERRGQGQRAYVGIHLDQEAR